MSDIQARLACASSFILQSPPGEVNDVFNDVRALVGDDEALEAGILPALQKYNIEQLIVADLPNKQQLMICPSGNVQDEPNRFIEPSTAKAWLFDHLRLSASDPVDIQVDQECDVIRVELEKAASGYGKEHFSDGVSKVFTSEQRKLKPAPKPKPTSVPAPAPTDVEEQSEMQEDAHASTSETHAETEMQEDKEESSKIDTELVDPETAPPADEGATTDVAEPAASTEEALPSEEKAAVVDTDMTAEDPATAEKTEEARSTEESAAKEEASTTTTSTDQVPVSPQTEEEQEEEIPVESLPKKFSLYFVGNKYNPSNYWTGRWRSTYELDLSQSQPTLTGTIQINVHFFEQGNVQLATNFTPTIALPESVNSSSSPADIAKATIKAISKVEEEYQLELNEAYRDMADRTFRNLRRVLPITRQKMDWAKIASYKIGKARGGE